MAIFADYTHISQTISETETYQEDVTYPPDLPEGHPNYELRSQAVAETFPVVTTEETLLENAYIVITNYNVSIFKKCFFSRYNWKCFGDCLTP